MRRASRLGMHRALILLLPACAGFLLAACLGAFADRYARGNAALSTGEGAVYLVVLSPILQDALNRCIPPGTPHASPVIVLVADINAAGHAERIDIEPASDGTRCVEHALSGRALPRPPLKGGETAFPLGLKIDSR